MKTITKSEFVAILEAAQINSSQQHALHAEFERRHPEAHESFLRWLQLDDQEVLRIREFARKAR